MTIKVPPPVGIATKDPVFNRWLLELTSILNNSGQLNPGVVPGLDALTAQVAALQLTVTALQGDVATNTADITTINGEITSIDAAITVLQQQPVVRNGTVAPTVGVGNANDWYADTVGKHIYVNVAGTWTLIL